MILLWEDRQGRAGALMGEDYLQDIAKYDSIHVMTSDELKEKTNSLLNITPNEYGEFFESQFTALFIHASAFQGEEGGLDIIREICNVQNISIVLFSGGISQVIYSPSNKKEVEILRINVNLFYNQLISFLEYYEKCEHPEKFELLYLPYGKNWELVLLLRYRQLLGLNIPVDAEDSRLDEIDNLAKKCGELSVQELTDKIDARFLLV